jgi:hypothetical protein
MLPPRTAAARIWSAHARRACIARSPRCAVRRAFDPFRSAFWLIFHETDVLELPAAACRFCARPARYNMKAFIADRAKWPSEESEVFGHVTPNETAARFHHATRYREFFHTSQTGARTNCPTTTCTASEEHHGEHHISRPPSPSGLSWASSSRLEATERRERRVNRRSYTES